MTSRLLGLLNSCAASAMHQFGLSPELARGLTVQMVIDRCQFKHPPQKDLVISTILELLEVDKGIDNLTHIEFPEPKLTSGALCPLEKEIFLGVPSLVFTGRNGLIATSTSVKVNPQPVAAEFTREQLESVLSSTEITVYGVAASQGNRQKLLELNAKARDRLIKSGALASPTTTSEESTDVVDSEFSQDFPAEKQALSQSAISPSKSIEQIDPILRLPSGRKVNKPSRRSSSSLGGSN